MRRTPTYGNIVMKYLLYFCIAILISFGICLNAEEGININILSNTNSENVNNFYKNDGKPFKINEFDVSNKEEYLKKFYSVWDDDKINENKDSIFYIVPSLKNAITYNKELENLKKTPPNKKAKNYAKIEKQYRLKINSLENKIKNLLGMGENLMPNTLDEFLEILDNMNLDSFLTNPQIGIIINATSVRAVPTNKPRYKSKDDFPFDRWQISFIFEGTPIVISHFSKDKKYAHIQGPFVYGWVDSRSIAFVSNSMKRKILDFESYKIPNKDFVPIFYKNQWILDARIGQIFPYNKRHDKIITFYRDIDNYAQIREVDFDQRFFSDFPMPFSAEKMSLLIHTMLGQKYGWGGLLGNRDCSSFTRDSFAQFGIFLPRNSAAQAKFKGKFIDISKMTEEKKEEYIVENAIPFGSIIWLKGHIMLYIGHININGHKRAVVVHNSWGVNPIINNKRENIRLGGVYITTLHIGGSFTSNTPIKNSLLSRIEGITNIYDIESKKDIDLSSLSILYAEV